MDYDGGDSGKSSPSSRPTTTQTPDDSVVTPSLVTSIITDNADHQPVPIEAPCKGRSRESGALDSGGGGGGRGHDAVSLCCKT